MTSLVEREARGVCDRGDDGEDGSDRVESSCVRGRRAVVGDEVSRMVVC